MQLRVTQFDEPVLREAGAPVEEFNDELRTLANDMLETMHAHEGIGLAAQQVGKALQFFVADMRVSEAPLSYQWTYDGRHVPMDMIMPLAVCNPQVQLSGLEEPYEEGCLSFPGVRGEVLRPAQVVMKFQDVQGHAHELTATGLFGRVLQHEYDHCQGTLFIDRMSVQVRRGLDTKLKKLKRATRDWLKEQGAAKS